MKYLSASQLYKNGYMVYELGYMRIKVYTENGKMHLRSKDVLGVGEVWDVFKPKQYGKMLKHFKALKQYMDATHKIKQLYK